MPLHNILYVYIFTTVPQAIQTFVPCIFDRKNSMNEILGIRITSFLMENYAEIFKVCNVYI